MRLLSRGDFIDLYHRFRLHGITYILKYFQFGYFNKVQAHWDVTESPPVQWWYVPAIHRYWNNLITGDSEKTYFQHVCEQYLDNKKNIKIISHIIKTFCART